MKARYLIVVPGLGGENLGLRIIINSWNRYGIRGYIHDVNWRGDEKSFKPKLQRLTNQIDELSSKGNVSLLGTSAGGSAVVNAFYERKNKIHKVINVCGRLREGINVNPTLAIAAKTSQSFKESVLLCEEIQQDFTNSDRKRILTIRPLFDEIVPTPTVNIKGATNEKIFSVEHMLSIALAMTIYSKKIINFLNSQ